MNGWRIDSREFCLFFAQVNFTWSPFFIFIAHSRKSNTCTNFGTRACWAPSGLILNAVWYQINISSCSQRHLIRRYNIWTWFSKWLLLFVSYSYIVIYLKQYVISNPALAKLIINWWCLGFLKVFRSSLTLWNKEVFWEVFWEVCVAFSCNSWIPCKLVIPSHKSVTFYFMKKTHFLILAGSVFCQKMVRAVNHSAVRLTALIFL